MLNYQRVLQTTLYSIVQVMSWVPCWRRWDAGTDLIYIYIEYIYIMIILYIIIYIYYIRWWLTSEAGTAIPKRKAEPSSQARWQTLDETWLWTYGWFSDWRKDRVINFNYVGTGLDSGRLLDRGIHNWTTRFFFPWRYQGPNRESSWKQTRNIFELPKEFFYIFDMVLCSRMFQKTQTPLYALVTHGDGHLLTSKRNQMDPHGANPRITWFD